MYAVLRLNTFDPAGLDAHQDALAEFDRIHSAQPGYVGTMSVDIDGGKRFVLNLWNSPEDAAAALEVVGPAVGRLLVPLMAEPSEFIGAGEVTSTDLALDPSPGSPHPHALK
ncbi:hypothetical protein ACFRFH_13335 [Leifsonia sp. NPDC056824]|uniref:hypothetical protein n=1 Tax=Leifsonia sp. NPDC056824 TaxID=3345953 RepID=UPI0036CF4F5D